MLSVKDLWVSYGAIKALKGVSLKIGAGEVVTVIGSNGAGKSTLLKTISRLIEPKSGTIDFCGQAIIKSKPYQLVDRGLIHVPEGRAILKEMTVWENLILGAHRRKDKQGIKLDIEMALSYFPVLKDRLQQAGGTLSGGEQQMLAIARALMARPKLLMLDEPSLGLAPMFVNEIFKIFVKLKEQGITILLVEQNATQALSIADKGYVLDLGKVILAQDARELLKNKAIVNAYLGKNKSIS